MPGELHKIGLAAFLRCLPQPKELHIEALEALLWAYRNQVVSHDDIVHALWGDEGPDNASQIISERIGELRRRLARRRIHILSIRGKGYMLTKAQP